ncbi:unnamed protein product [Ectocarpus fasciculatus]
MVLPGSLTYRTYGYLMVAYAVEKQWGAVVELALGTGRWPEKISGGPEGRFHPPELRETTCAVALKWLLTQGVGGGCDSVGHGGVGVGDGEVGEQQAEAVERALDYRKCGRELFTRLLASGAPLRSVRVIKAALGGMGAEPGPSSSDSTEGTEDAPIFWKQTMPFWGDPEKPSSSTSTSPPSKDWKPLSSDWLLSSLPEEEAEREIAAQALHVCTVVEVFLRLYSTCEQPGANGLHSPMAVGLLQQAISAACLVDDPDLADRLLMAWLERAHVTQQLSQARLRSALRISLSEVLAAFFAEGQGEEGVYRGLSLIGRCRDAGLLPYPFDFLGAMRACNTAGLYATALRLFDQLTAPASGDPSPAVEYPKGDPDYPEETSNYPAESGADCSLSAADSGSDPDSDAEMGGSLPASPEQSASGEQQQQQNQSANSSGRKGKAQAEGTPADDGSSNREGGEGDDEREGQAGTGETAEGSNTMRFENLNDIPDGELLPAAAATIALESCFLGGRRDQAMEIVWQASLIRRRHPLTEACRNRAIVALTSAGHPDMALDMARGMEQDRHYADRATVEFVERFEKWAFDAAEAYDQAQEEGAEQQREESDEDDRDDDDDDDWEEEEEYDEGQEEGRETAGVGESDAGDTDAGDELVSSQPSLSASSSFTARDRDGGGGGVSSSDRPEELVLRFLPLLSEALRSKLRPGEDGDKTPQVDAAEEEKEDNAAAASRPQL